MIETAQPYNDIQETPTRAPEPALTRFARLSRQYRRAIATVSVASAVGLGGAAAYLSRVDCQPPRFSSSCLHTILDTRWTPSPIRTHLKDMAGDVETAIAQPWSESQVVAYGESMAAETDLKAISEAGNRLKDLSQNKRLKPHQGGLLFAQYPIRIKNKDLYIGRTINPDIVTEAEIMPGPNLTRTVLEHKTEPRNRYDRIAPNALIFENIIVHDKWHTLSPVAKKFFIAQQLYQPQAVQMTADYAASHFFNNYRSPDAKVDSTEVRAAIAISNYLDGNIQEYGFPWIADGIAMSLLAPDFLNAQRAERFTEADQPYIKRYGDMARQLLENGAIVDVNGRYQFIQHPGLMEKYLIPASIQWNIDQKMKNPAPK